MRYLNIIFKIAKKVAPLSLRYIKPIIRNSPKLALLFGSVLVVKKTHNAIGYPVNVIKTLYPASGLVQIVQIILIVLFMLKFFYPSFKRDVLGKKAKNVSYSFVIFFVILFSAASLSLNKFVDKKKEILNEIKKTKTYQKHKDAAILELMLMPIF